MAEESEELKQVGEVENPKPEGPADTPTDPAGDHSSPSPAAAFSNISINIWPPTQRTRDAVINRLIENLSTPSILSKRYGTLPPDEASSVARLIEQEAFDVASTSPPSAAAGEEGVRAEASVDEGIEILQIYSKEISRRMLESVKARASSTSVTAADAQGNAASAPAGSGDVAESVSEPAAQGNAASDPGGSGDVVESVPEPAAPAGQEISSSEPQPPTA